MKIEDHLTQILSQGISGNQAQLVAVLHQQGVKTTQSTVSRALKKINAIKGVDEKGGSVYSLPRPEGMRVRQEGGLFGTLVHKILDNGHMIVVHTRPGTAPTVAKVIDDYGFDQVIGTVAGDDAIIIVPADVKKTRQVAMHIRSYLTGVGLL
ncbi:MAG: hypothetical protein ABIJ31_04240 [Pseudomonadota bacterium]